MYKILIAFTISVFTSCLLFGLPWLASCRPCPPHAAEACPTIGRSGNYKKFQCPPGHYNDLASLIFNTNDDAIRNLFSKNTDSEFQYSSIIIFFVTCFFLSIFSYGVVVPAGLFVPVIVTGASYGRFVGNASWQTLESQSWSICCVGCCFFSWWNHEDDGLALCNYSGIDQ